MQQDRKSNQKYFTPESLLQTFKDYRKWVEENPLKKNDFVGGSGKPVTRELQRPLTMEGFESYVFEQGGISDLCPYFANRESRYNDFVEVCRSIKTAIRADQIEGGMCGIYHHNITARLNGLTDKHDTKNDTVTEIVVTYQKHTPENEAKNKIPFFGTDGNDGYYVLDGDKKNLDRELPLFLDI